MKFCIISGNERPLVETPRTFIYFRTSTHLIGIITDILEFQRIRIETGILGVPACEFEGYVQPKFGIP